MQSIREEQSMAPRVTFYNGMRLRRGAEMGEIIGFVHATPLVSVAWPSAGEMVDRKALLDAIARGDITVEPSVGMRVETEDGSGRVSRTRVEGKWTVVDYASGSTTSTWVLAQVWDDRIRTGAWAILAPEQPAPHLPPDVDPEATWDGEEDDSCDQKVRADQLAAALKREAEENVRLRSDLDEERFRARALQERLEAAEKRAQEAEDRAERMRQAQNSAADSCNRLVYAAWDINKALGAEPFDAPVPHVQSIVVERNALHARALDLEAKIKRAEAAERLYEDAFEAIAADIDGDKDRAEMMLSDAKERARPAGIELRYAVGHYRVVVNVLRLLRSRVTDLEAALNKVLDAKNEAESVLRAKRLAEGG